MPLARARHAGSFQTLASNTIFLFLDSAFLLKEFCDRMISASSQRALCWCCLEAHGQGHRRLPLPNYFLPPTLLDQTDPSLRVFVISEDNGLDPSPEACRSSEAIAGESSVRVLASNNLLSRALY